MAVVQNFNQDPQQQSDQQQNVSQPVNVSGTSASPSGGGAQPSGSSAAPTIGSQNAPTSSGRFTNIQQYIQANQGYNQGQGLAGQIAGDVSNKAQNVQNQFNQAQQQFQTQANQNQVQYDPNLVNQALSDPSKFAQNQGNVSSFQNLLNATYGGPTEISGSKQFQTQAQSLQGLANLGGTESGRQTLLQQLYGKPTYGQGQQTLDNLLLQANPQQLGQLNQLGQTTSTLSNTINQGLTQAQQQAQQYAQQAQQAAQQTQGALNTDITKEQKSLQDAATNLQNQRQQQYDTVLKQYQSGQIPLDQLQAAGIAPTYQAGSPLFGVNVGDYLTNNVGNATVGNVSTPADVAKFQALAKLSGQADLANYANQSTNQLNPNVYNFNAQNFGQALESGASNFLNSYLNTISPGSASAFSNTAASQLPGLASGYAKSLNDTLQGLLAQTPLSQQNNASLIKSLQTLKNQYGI